MQNNSRKLMQNYIIKKIKNDWQNLILNVLKINLYHSPSTIFLASIGGKDNRLFIHYTCVIKAANRSKWIVQIMLLDVIRFDLIKFVWYRCGNTHLFQTTKLIKNQEASFQSHSVLEYIQIKGSYPDQMLPQHESLYPIGLISEKN